MKAIALLLPEQFFASGVAGLIDAFAIANFQAAASGSAVLRWRLLSADGLPVRASSGLEFAADGCYDQVQPGELLIVPGLIYRTIPSFEHTLQQQAALIARLRQWHAAGHVLAGCCTGVALLAESGVLDQQPATISWWLAGWFKRRYPAVCLSPHALVTDSPQLLCSGATTAYLDLALRLIERLVGPDIAQACARVLLLDPHRASQAPYTSLPSYSGHNDPMVSDCQRWLHAHLEQPFRLAALASAVNCSERTLMRRFRLALGDTPLHYLQKLRLFAARRLLETTALGLGEIAQRVGYSDLSAFRRLFIREVECTPARYRRRFGGQAGVGADACRVLK